MSSSSSWAAGWFGAERGSPYRDPHPAQVRTPLASEVSTVGPGSNAAAATLAVPAPRWRPRTALVVGIRDVDRAVVVSVADEASTDDLHPLEFALARLLARRVPLAVIDCSALTLLSRLAMGMLVRLRRDLGRWQGRVKLACLPPPIRSALEVAGLAELFEVHATVEEALATAGNALATAEAR
jgi:anti-sigma B factor antagonist